MSKEQLKAFQEKVNGDITLQEQLKAATSADDVVAIAKEAGISYQYLYWGFTGRTNRSYRWGFNRCVWWGYILYRRTWDRCSKSNSNTTPYYSLIWNCPYPPPEWGIFNAFPWMGDSFLNQIDDGMCIWGKCLDHTHNQLRPMTDQSTTRLLTVLEESTIIGGYWHSKAGGSTGNRNRVIAPNQLGRVGTSSTQFGPE